MKPTTISLLQKYKQEKKRFATITAYDYSFAKLFADEGLNVMLVGDSLGMTVQGHDSTLPVTVADIAYHTAAVRRGAPNCLLLADLPFMAYATPEQAFENAATVMRANADRTCRSCMWSLRFNTTVSEYFRWLQSSGARR